MCFQTIRIRCVSSFPWGDLVEAATPDVAEAPQHLRAAERSQRAASMPSALGLGAWCWPVCFSMSRKPQFPHMVNLVWFPVDFS